METEAVLLERKCPLCNGDMFTYTGTEYVRCFDCMYEEGEGFDTELNARLEK